jgi:hypothetical protein
VCSGRRLRLRRLPRALVQDEDTLAVRHLLRLVRTGHGYLPPVLSTGQRVLTHADSLCPLERHLSSMSRCSSRAAFPAAAGSRTPSSKGSPRLPDRGGGSRRPRRYVAAGRFTLQVASAPQARAGRLRAATG